MTLVIVGSLLTAFGAHARVTAAPANTAPPTISGTPTVGQTLTASDGTWSGSPTSFAYQWLRCNALGNSCAKAANGTQKKYTLVGADAARTMRVDVTATNADGSTPARSEQTAAVAPRPAGGTAPRNTAAPTIDGTPQAGGVLTANPGTWTGTPAPTFAFQWQRCDFDVAACANVSGATARTYSVGGADVGYRLRVQVTGRNATGSATASSAITTVVEPAVEITNNRPTVRIVSVRFVGAKVYARFRICDDDAANLAILQTDSRPGRVSQTRRFATRAAPMPCGVYTRNWTPAARFRGPGRYTVTLRVRDSSGATSLPARRTFFR